MPNFRVFVEGKNIASRIGETVVVGFFTTRAVRARSAEEASEKVQSMIINDWTAGRYVSWNHGHAPTITVERVWRTSWLRDLFFKNDGHTFYAADESEDEA